MKDTSRRRISRSFSVPLKPTRGLADEAVRLIMPWARSQYPGPRRGFAELLGIGISTSRDYLRGRAALPAHHADRLAAYHERCAGEHTRMARLLRDYGQRRGEEVRRLRGRALTLARQTARDEDRPA
jgi:hypothetical protein